jgi:hypothetical protein
MAVTKVNFRLAIGSGFWTATRCGKGGKTQANLAVEQMVNYLQVLIAGKEIEHGD